MIMELINRLKTNMKFLKDLPNEAANDFVKDYEDAIVAIEFLSEKLQQKELKNQYSSGRIPADNPPKKRGKNKMTNYENLKQMTSDELAVAICNMISTCDRCPARRICIAGCGKANGLKAWMEIGVWTDMETDE